MDREARSQPTLTQKIWGSSDTSSNLARTRSLSSSNRNKPASSVRPLATIYSRPESRADSRPQSRVDHSRPQSRIDHSRPQSRLERKDQDKIVDRPKSGVRPLSGRVFMRRSSERGWIAKAYPDAANGSMSQCELDIMDDLSDCDSFFDDDFDMETQDEKLGLLLSCNTLGVESKGRRPDWIAGEVDIPRFHCPRCRDHWYGITDVPCDEELARMKREGLWPIGKDGSKKLNSYGGGKTLRPVSSRKEYNALSGDSSAVKLPKIRGKKGPGDEDDKWREGGGGGEGDGGKKRKKRITFKLGDESQSGSSGPSGVSLDGDGDLREGRGQRLKDSGLERDGFGGLTDGSGTGRGGLGGRGSGAGGVDGLGGQNGSSGSGHGEDDDKTGRRRGEGGDGSGLYSGLGSGDESLLHGGKSSKRGGGRKGGQNTTGEDGLSGANSSASSRYNRGDLNSLTGGNHDGKNSRNGFGRSSYDAANGKTSSNGDGSGTKSGNGIGEGEMGYGKSTDANNKNTSGGLDSSSQVSRAGSKGSGSRRGSLAMSDHGKNVRKGVGYMRAVSPTSSEWGDPQHGRSFISSTATSKTGSTSNLLRDLDKDKKNDDRPTSRSLPALVPQIKRKEPLFSDLLGGFQFTRAWTFSYHNKM